MSRSIIRPGRAHGGPRCLYRCDGLAKERHALCDGGAETGCRLPTELRGRGCCDRVKSVCALAGRPLGVETLVHGVGADQC